jgi:hypothetical protein
MADDAYPLPIVAYPARSPATQSEVDGQATERKNPASPGARPWMAVAFQVEGR